MSPPEGEYAKENRRYMTAAPGQWMVSAMQVIYEYCGGMDVHKKSVTVCAVTLEGKETRTYS